MSKKVKGESSLYKTVQKKKRKTFQPGGECAICKVCTDRTACNNRQGYIKLDLVIVRHIQMTKHTFVTISIELGMNIYAILKLVGAVREVLEKLIHIY